jgi:hypothetical protein
MGREIKREWKWRERIDAWRQGSIRRSMITVMPSMLPSMPKGEIVEILVVIDVNP